MKRSLLVGCATAALAVMPAAALAQSDQAEPRDNVDNAPIIIVTGEKFERSLQDTISSVSVVSAEEIDDQNFQNIYDVIGQTANVASLFDGAGFTIRGLRNTGASTGDQTSDVASIYVDGVFIPSNLLTNGAFSLWDAQSVEIFRGPQSTIQGRNALAGAIVVRTVEPGDEFTGSFQAEAAEFDSYRASAGLTIPIATGQASLRLSGDYLTSDGFQENFVLNRDDIDESEAITGRATLLLTPDFAPRFSARFSFTYTDKDEGENRVIEALFPEQRASNQNLIDRQGAEAYIASAELSYDLTDAFSLTAITGYIDSNSGFGFDSDSGPGGSPDLQFTDNDDEIFTQELRLTYDGDGIDALLGGYFFDSRSASRSDNTTIVGTDFAFPDPATLAFLLGVSVPEATFIRQSIVATVPEFPVQLVRRGDVDIRNYAVFGEATIDLTDRIRLTLGARYDIENIDQVVFDATNVPPIVTGNPLLDPILAGVAAQFTNSVDLVADNEFTAFLPKAALAFDLSDDVTAAISYQRAYRAGGLSFNIFRSALAPAGSSQEDLESLNIVNSFEPEFTNNYEFALRSQWLDGDLTVNANIFYIDYTDQQINVQLSANPLDQLSDNVGASRLYGFELETVIRPTDRLHAYFNIGFTDTEFTEGGDVVGGRDLTGAQFTYAPRWTVGFGGRYEHPSGFFINLRSRLTDESFSFVDNDISGVNDSSFVVDAAIGWEGENVGVELFARNLFDEKFLTFNPINDPDPVGGGFLPNNNTTAIAGAPQIFGVRVRGGF